jgi:hypothetical protein
MRLQKECVRRGEMIIGKGALTFEKLATVDLARGNLESDNMSLPYNISIVSSKAAPKRVVVDWWGGEEDVPAPHSAA